MDKKNIATLQKDPRDEFYALARTHSEAIRKLLEEFDDDQLQFAMELEAYERERTKLEGEQPDRVLTSEEDESTCENTVK